MYLHFWPIYALCPLFDGPSNFAGPNETDRERERERESFIRNNLHNGVVSGAARGQALLGPIWTDSPSP